jgi:hypothetical protein
MQSRPISEVVTRRETMISSLSLGLWIQKGLILRLPRFVTILNRDALSRSETRTNPGIRSFEEKRTPI